VGNKKVSAVAGNGGAIRSLRANTRNNFLCFCSEFTLRAECWLWSCRGNRTHVEDTKDSVEILPPGGSRFLITLRM